MIRDFYNARPCCLDSLLSEPLRSRFSTSEWLGSVPEHESTRLELEQMCTELRRKLKVTNMHLERKLKEHKLSTPRLGSQLGAETFCYASLLDQLWREHVNVNGANPLLVSRQSLQAEGRIYRFVAPAGIDGLRPLCRRMVR